MGIESFFLQTLIATQTSSTYRLRYEIGICVSSSLSTSTYIDKGGQNCRSKFCMEPDHPAPSRTKSLQTIGCLEHPQTQIFTLIVNTRLAWSTQLILGGQGGDQEMLCRRLLLCQWVTQRCCSCCIFSHLCPHQHHLSYILRHLPHYTMCFG